MSYWNWGIWVAEDIPEGFRVKAWASAALIGKVPPMRSVPTEGTSSEKWGRWFSVATLWARAKRWVGPYEGHRQGAGLKLRFKWQAQVPGHGVALPTIGTSASPSVLLSVTCDKPPLRGQGPPVTPGLQPFPPLAKDSWGSANPLESDSPREGSLWHAFLHARITRGLRYLWCIATSEIGGTKNRRIHILTYKPHCGLVPRLVTSTCQGTGGTALLYYISRTDTSVLLWIIGQMTWHCQQAVWISSYLVLF